MPDIWLTRIAITDLKEAVINTFIALLGALIGGTVLYILGSMFFENTKQFLNYVPAISESMVNQAGIQMQEDNPVIAIIKTGFTGLPFKIYAAWAGYLSLSFPIFILVSVFARIVRFISLILMVYRIKNTLKLFVPTKKILWFHSGLWRCFIVTIFIQ